MKFGRFYTLFIILLFAAFAVVFNTFPRSVYSPLEKRELAQFPTFTWARLQSGAFTRDVSAWFSDSEPFRDHFMTLSGGRQRLFGQRSRGRRLQPRHRTLPQQSHGRRQRQNLQRRHHRHGQRKECARPHGLRRQQ